MNDRFKFRVWDKSAEQYIPRSQCILLSDGTLIQEIGGESVICDDAIVEQCTGLKDKNGKLIYEGDIVKNELHNNLVEWFKGGFWVNGFTNGARWEMYLYHQNLEVIGNIHENKELLND